VDARLFAAERSGDGDPALAACPAGAEQRDSGIHIPVHSCKKCM
jgi:hypothetical protein